MFSYLLTLICLSVFLVFIMLFKEGFSFLPIELALAPLAVDCLQGIALANFHMRSPLYKHLQASTKECKITILDQILSILYLVLLIMATRLQENGYDMPYTASCAPLAFLLLQRFVWHRSFIRAFRSPSHVLKFLFQVLFTNLIVNFSVRGDGYAQFDAIALLWPCYGFIALTFIFFAASLMLFISSACNQLTGQEEEPESGEEDGALFTCTISTGLFLNASFFMGFAIVGFMSLLREVKEAFVFEQGYIGIAITSLISGTFVLCQMKVVTNWYYFKLLKPQIASELLIALKAARPEDFEAEL